MVLMMSRDRSETDRRVVLARPEEILPVTDAAIQAVARK
jgi:hypothetical protein